jgi:hypothetical protein
MMVVIDPNVEFLPGVIEIGEQALVEQAAAHQASP